MKSSLPLLGSAIILLPIFSFAQLTNSSATDSVAVMNRVNSFVDAFSHLRWEEFQQFFAPEVTAFFPPSAHHPGRAENRKEVFGIFKKVFENMKQHGMSQIEIHPKDIRVQILPSCAIVTFHLEDPDLFGRRTLVFQKQKKSWLIIHLHASGLKRE